VTESFHAWLRRQLQRRDWSQADLARRMNAATGAVSNWVRGERIPNPQSCERLADVLGEDPDFVLTLAGHRPPDPSDDDPRIGQLVTLARKMPSHELDELIKWAEFRLSGYGGKRLPVE
jgi:transcriptional regulator with XRE-family HTH domain